MCLSVDFLTSDYFTDTIFSSVHGSIAPQVVLGLHPSVGEKKVSQVAPLIFHTPLVCLLKAVALSLACFMLITSISSILFAEFTNIHLYASLNTEQCENMISVNTLALRFSCEIVSPDTHSKVSSHFCACATLFIQSLINN